MIGDGSNIVWRDEGFDGLVIVNKIKRYEDVAQDEVNHLVTIGGGENWDEAVARTVAAGLTGIEALSLVPGTAGATPVQNVGAYGQEVAHTITTVEAYDLQSRSFVSIPAADCAFGYRTSRFKAADRHRFLITAVTFQLAKGNPQPPFYRSVEQYFAEHNITEFTPQILRDAVIAIRQSKLPDPATVANNGSFFANPVIDEALFARIQSENPDIPHWPTNTPGQVKLPAAWLVEHAGFKDYHDTETGIATWPAQSLVLVNEHADSTTNLLAFKQKIVDEVEKRFHITLIQEPELLP
jgi:UDP-N-acetylmuramate dehydrogenase